MDRTVDNTTLDEWVDTALDGVLTFHTKDYSDLNKPGVDAYLTDGKSLGADEAIRIITGSSFRDHVRVSQPADTTRKLLQYIRTSKITVVEGARGSGKSTYAGEICDRLYETDIVPIYVNGDRIRGVNETTDPALAYRRHLLNSVRELTRDGSRMREEFLAHLVKESDCFLDVATVTGVSTPEEIAESMRTDAELASHWLAAIRQWRDQDVELQLSDVAAYINGSGTRVCFVMDNHDGFTITQLSALGRVLDNLKSELADSVSLVFLIRPSGASALIDALQFSASIERLDIRSMVDKVLLGRSEFARSDRLRSELLRLCHATSDDGQSLHPRITPELVEQLDSAAENMAEMFQEIGETGFEYVSTADFGRSRWSSLETIARWHNYNNREIFRSMRSFRERSRVISDHSTAVLRHVLMHASGLETSLAEDRQLLIPDVQIFHGGLLHLRWRLLQYMARQPKTFFSAENLREQFDQFEDKIAPITEALQALESREGLESGFVQRDEENGVPVWTILPAGELFIGGIAHTVEYLFLLALSDPSYVTNRKERLIQYSAADRAEIATSYVDRIMIPHFTREHPYLVRDRNPDELTLDEKEILKEFSRLFGYGQNRGWYLTRFVKTLESYCENRAVPLGNLSGVREIKWAINRLDRSATTAGINRA